MQDPCKYYKIPASSPTSLFWSYTLPLHALGLVGVELIFFTAAHTVLWVRSVTLLNRPYLSPQVFLAFALPILSPALLGAWGVTRQLGTTQQAPLVPLEASDAQSTAFSSTADQSCGCSQHHASELLHSTSFKFTRNLQFCLQERSMNREPDSLSGKFIAFLSF